MKRHGFDLSIAWPPSGKWPPLNDGINLPVVFWAALLGAASGASGIIHLALTQGFPSTCFGEVAAGVLLGPAYLSLVPASQLNSELLSHIGNMGVCLLLFEAGLRVDTQLLASRFLAVVVWALTASAIPATIAGVVLHYGLHLDRAGTIAGACAFVPACSRVTRSLLQSAKNRGREMDGDEMVSVVAYFADFLGFIGFVLAQMLRARSNIPESQKSSQVQGVLVSVLMLNVAMVLRQLAACIIRDPNVHGTGKNSRQKAGTPGCLDLGFPRIQITFSERKSADAEQSEPAGIRVHGEMFGSLPRGGKKSREETLRSTWVRGERWDLSSDDSEEDDENAEDMSKRPTAAERWVLESSSDSEDDLGHPRALQRESDDLSGRSGLKEASWTDSPEKEHQQAGSGERGRRREWGESVGSGTKERWETSLHRWKHEVKMSRDTSVSHGIETRTDAGQFVRRFDGDETRSNAGRLIRELDEILKPVNSLARSHSPEAKSETQQRRSILRSPSSIEREEANRRRWSQSSPLSRSIRFLSDAAPENVAENNHQNVVSWNQGDAPKVDKDSEQKGKKKADKIPAQILQMRSGGTLHPDTSSAVFHKLYVTTMMSLIMGVLLGSMVLADFLGSTYALGALLSGLVFGASDYSVHVWNASACNVVQWAARIFFTCSVGSAIATTPWLNLRVIVGAVCVSLAELGTRLLVALCMHAIFLNHRKPHVDKSSCTGSILDLHHYRGLLLGAACGARDELALWMLLSFFETGHLSSEALAITSWAIMISSILCPILFSILLVPLNAETVDERRFGIGIVWVTQFLSEKADSKGHGDDAGEQKCVRLVVAGFTPDSHAEENGVMLGDILIGFRDEDSDELVDVSQLLRGDAKTTSKGGGNAGGPGEREGNREDGILLVEKAMVGPRDSICELHLLRRSDPASSILPLPTFTLNGTENGNEGVGNEGQVDGHPVRHLRAAMAHLRVALEPDNSMLQSSLLDSPHNKTEELGSAHASPGRSMLRSESRATSTFLTMKKDGQHVDAHEWAFSNVTPGPAESVAVNDADGNVSTWQRSHPVHVSGRWFGGLEAGAESGPTHESARSRSSAASGATIIASPSAPRRLSGREEGGGARQDRMHDFGAGVWGRNGSLAKEDVQVSLQGVDVVIGGKGRSGFAFRKAEPEASVVLPASSPLSPIYRSSPTSHHSRSSADSEMATVFERVVVVKVPRMCDGRGLQGLVRLM